MNKRASLTSAAVVMVLSACGGDGSVATNESPSAPAGNASPFEAPKPDTVALSKAKKGDLISLPFYPDVGKYGGTADVRGMKSFRMEMPLINNSRMFSPSVLIGSPRAEDHAHGIRRAEPDR